MKLLLSACLGSTVVFMLLPYSIASVNPCCSFPCENKGVCVDDGDKYTCDCTRTGYYGVNCDIPHWSTWFKMLIKPSTETLHYIMTHFSWLWGIVNNVGFLQNFVMRGVYFSRTDLIPVPHVYTSDHDYATLEAAFNRSYYARTLPPVPKNCPTPFGVHGKKDLPSAEDVANQFLKRREFVTDHANSSLLFAFFAQHFTHQYFKTIYHKPAFTWGRHGVDVSHIYGQGVERENNLRSFKDGKLKSQILNGEEFPPCVKDANVSMQYPKGTKDDEKFALGHPFYGLLPGLFAVAVIWLREHNRVCDILRAEHPHWDDDRLFQTGKLIITGEVINIVIEDYVNHLANYNLRLIYKPDLLFGDGYDYDNRIHVEFNHMYHWHPFNPDEYNISGSMYSIDEFMYHPEVVVKHGMSKFVDSMSRTLAGKMSHHNHGKHTLEVGIEVIKHQRKLRMQSFNNYRKRFGLEPYKSFEEMTGGNKELSAELQEAYGDVNAIDLYVGFFVEKSIETSPLGLTMVAFGAPYSLRGLLSNPVSSPSYWKPSTFGGEVGFEMVKTASLEKLFCQNIAGKCPLVTFRVPEDIARETRKIMSAKKKDEL